MRWAWMGCVIVKTAYCYAWDLTMDWGLLRKDAKVWGLRQVTYFPTPFYAWCAVSNFLARISWSLAISPRQFPEDWSMFLQVVEILRRVQWLIIRVEKEVADGSGVSDPMKTRVAGRKYPPLPADLSLCNSPVEPKAQQH